MSVDSRAKHVVALAAGILCWSTVPIFIRYLSEGLGTGLEGNFTQNLYRYIPACALLWTLSLVFFRRRLAVSGRHLLGLSAPAVVICGHQLAWVAGITWTTPTTASLLSQTQVVVVSLLALAVFPDERSTIRGPRFVAGSVLALVGVVGFIYAGGREVGGSAAGYTVVFVAALVWAVYTVVAKAATRGLHPVVSFTYVSTAVLVFFALTTPFLGDPGKVTRVPGGVVAALVISGIVGIALAHMFFYTALGGLGAAVCGTAILAVPACTGLWSYLIYGETLRPMQFVFGAVLLVGAGLAMRRTRPPEPID